MTWLVRISGLSRLIFWFVFDCKSRLLGRLLGPIAPWLFGLAIGIRPRRVK